MLVWVEFDEVLSVSRHNGAEAISVGRHDRAPVLSVNRHNRAEVRPVFHHDDGAEAATSTLSWPHSRVECFGTSCTFAKMDTYLFIRNIF